MVPYRRIISFANNHAVQNAVGLLLTAIAIVSLIMSWSASIQEHKQSVRVQSYVQCQADWTNFLYQSIQANRGAATDANKALDELINTISTSTSRAQSAAALEKYKQARAQQVKSQNDNPLPPAPKTVCQLEDS
jgi:hypothetical protein